jgi:broad specificity phosphatase PhoE
LFAAFEHVWRKLWLFALGVLHLLFSSDRQWLSQAPPSRDSDELEQERGRQQLVPRRSKRIVFVRHAESEWNVVFNRGVDWRALVRFVRACVREWLMLPTPDSVFIDSPLSRTGIQQARALFNDVHVCSSSARDIEAGAPTTAAGSACDANGRTEGDMTKVTVALQYLSSPVPNSIVVTSNLRRAIDTARVVSAARLAVPGETIHVLSALQEIGRNIDTLAISDAYALQTQALASALHVDKRSDGLFNVSESHGNKAVLGCGRTRLEAFARWSMRRSEDVVVVYGHSLWFRAFCQEYFPSGVPHDAKRLKLANCGVVSFTLEKYDGSWTPPATAKSRVVGDRAPRFRIAPESFVSVR